MLDHCSISHKGGIVLWSRSFTPDAASVASSSSSPVSALVREALIEGRTAEDKFEKDSYAVKWTFVNDLELIFVVVYQRILQLTYVDELLNALKALFIKYFEPAVRSFVESLHAPFSPAGTSNKGKSDVVKQWDISSMLSGWDKLFDELVKTLQERAAEERRSRLRAPIRNAPAESAGPPAATAELAAEEEESTSPSKDPDAPLDEQQIAANVQALKNKLRGSGGGRRRGRGGGAGAAGKKGRSLMGDGWDSGSAISSDNESSKTSKKAPQQKQQRRWGDQPVNENEMASLDYSLETDNGADASTANVSALVDKSSLGTRTKDGLYEVKDWEFAIAESLNTSSGAASISAKGEQRSGVLGSLFARLTGGKSLTDADLKPVLEGMKQHLMKKNVAREIADKVCEGVGESLVGKKVGGFQTINSAVRQALSTSITRILTPKTSTDLLLSIRTKLSAPLPSSQQRLPYSITFVGVNGVGKSTNLSKVCFWLIQNGLKVLIAACDTFRSGAVEQLRVHVRNLSMLTVDGTSAKGKVELFERGYGKDAAGIAREAINFAKDNDFDVVLIDTAGRMQDNEPLMRALAKLVSVNNPDKILFVGEALVGNEAVDQLQKFDRSLKDFSSAQGGAGKGRGIDGMLVTKWDTVDDKVGAALSMTYVTGQPIVFVGCGQTYTDLRQLRVQNVVQAILDD